MRMKEEHKKKKTGSDKSEFAKIKQEHSQFILDLLDEDCTLTLGIIKQQLEERFDLNVSIGTIWNHIVKNIGFTLKRTKPVEVRRNDPRTLEKRKDFIVDLAKKGAIYTDNCIFIDEAGFNANLIRGQGWSKKGEESVVTTRTKRALNLSILAAISFHGVERFEAKIVKGGTTGRIFAEFIQNLINMLDRTNAPAQYFIMDNASIHRSPEVKKVLENTRHKQLFIPPYSPFLNAIEECFSKVKTLVKRKPGLSQNDLAVHIGNCSEMITKSDCEGWVNHCLSFFDDCVAKKEIY